MIGRRDIVERHGQIGPHDQRDLIGGVVAHEPIDNRPVSPPIVDGVRFCNRLSPALEAVDQGSAQESRRRRTRFSYLNISIFAKILAKGLTFARYFCEAVSRRKTLVRATGITIFLLDASRERLQSVTLDGRVMVAHASSFERGECPRCRLR